MKLHGILEIIGSVILFIFAKQVKEAFTIQGVNEMATITTGLYIMAVFYLVCGITLLCDSKRLSNVEKEVQYLKGVNKIENKEIRNVKINADSIKCPNCGFTNKKYGDYCQNCGYKFK